MIKSQVRSQDPGHRQKEQDLDWIKLDQKRQRGSGPGSNVALEIWRTKELGPTGAGPIIRGTLTSISPQVGFTPGHQLQYVHAVAPGQAQLRGAATKEEVGAVRGRGGLLRTPLSLLWDCGPIPWLRSSSWEFFIPWLLSLSSASPLAGFRHFLVCFQLTPALPCSEFLPPPNPSLLPFIQSRCQRTLSEG